LSAASAVTRCRTRWCSGRRWSCTRRRGWRTWRSPAGWRRRRRSSPAGGDASTTSGSRGSRIACGRAARAVFPPEEVARVKAIACELPRQHDLPLSRFSRAELHRLVVERGISEASASTIARWLREDALKPWQHRSWVFPTDPDFLARAGPVLDLYQGRFEGKLLHPGEYVICADEKPSIQGRARIPRAASALAPLARAEGRAHLPAPRSAHLPGRARHRPPGRQAPARLRPLRAAGRDRRLRPARLPGDDQGALRLRPPRLLDRRQRLLAPRPKGGRPARAALAEPRPRPPAGARHRWNEIAEPFDWSFTRHDLAALITRLTAHQPQLQLAA
jgi:hypothetical protein